MSVEYEVVVSSVVVHEESLCPQGSSRTNFQVLVLRPQVLCPCPRALSPCPFPCPQVLENITMVSSWLTQHTGSVSGLEASAGVWLTATESGDQLWALVAWL